MLELWLGWCHHHRQLAEDLRVRVERVAARTPLLVGKRRPLGGHDGTLPVDIAARPSRDPDREAADEDLDGSGSFFQLARSGRLPEADGPASDAGRNSGPSTPVRLVTLWSGAMSKPVVS